MMAGPVEGSTVHLRALGLLRRHAELRRYVVVPILVTVIAALLLYGGLLAVALPAVARWVGAEGVLGDLLRVLLVVLLFVAVGFVMVRVGVVLGSPWYGKLSERVEELVTGEAPPAHPLTAAGIARDLGRALRFEVGKLTIVLPLAGLLLLANLVPVAGQAVATVGGFGLATFVACLDFLDGPLERRRLRFRQKLRYVRTHLPGSAGFGLVCVPLLAVPVVNLLWIPLCVAAGTLFWCEATTREAERGRLVVVAPVD